MLRQWFLLASCLIALVGCQARSESGGATGLFLIDTLTRSDRLPGVEFHLRYAERASSRLILHIAFYNNGPADLAQVQGIDVRAARLAGGRGEVPVDVSASLKGGIVPAGGWLSGGATNGALTFEVDDGTDFTLAMPGFPDLPFRLDTPLRAAPEPPVVPPVRFLPNYEIESTGDAGVVLRVEVIEVTDTALDLTMAVHDPAEEEPGEATLNAVRRAVVFDTRWNQYRATPGPVLIPDLAATSDDLSEAALVARFPRPAGEFVLLKLHEFPLLRIPLRPEEPLELATVADLPPSTVPRTPLAEAVAVQQQATPLEEVLASLNRALARGTREEYVEHFVPALRGAQGQLFDTIRSLPLEEVTLQARGETMTQTATGDGDTLQHPVSWSYAVVGAEPGAHLSADVELGLRRDTGRWQIAQIGGQAPFWALGPTEAERAGPFWIFYRPSAEPRLASLKADLAPALQVVEERFPDRLEPVHLMFVTETPQEFADLTGRDPARFSGLALSRYRIEEGGIATTEATFYINGATFWAASEADRRQTLVHELAHLLLAPTTMPFTPVWLVEGMAMEIAGDLPQEVMRAQIAAGEIDIFRLDAFTTQPGFGLHDPGGAQTAADYAYAAYLARFLVERYGFETFLAFYDSFANVPVEDVRDELAAVGQSQDLSRTLGKLAGDLTPERLQIAYGIDLATLEQEFVTWLRQQVG